VSIRQARPNGFVSHRLMSGRRIFEPSTNV
jgi:hypothetical protein